MADLPPHLQHWLQQHDDEVLYHVDRDWDIPPLPPLRVLYPRGFRNLCLANGVAIVANLYAIWCSPSLWWFNTSLALVGLGLLLWMWRAWSRP
jgi:hypothetical protein